jgi:hypothetical protein
MAFRPSKRQPPVAKTRRRRSSRAREDFTLAVFGVVNSGKTSLARALLMEPDFGEVSIVPGSTKVAKEMARKLPRAQSTFTLIDTPGVEGFVGIVSDFKEETTGLEERDWLKRFDSWLAARVSSLGPADSEKPTVEHRFEDAYKAMQNASVLCLVHKGSDLLQENVREDVAALMEVVRRIRKPVFCVLKDACSEAFTRHSDVWKEFSESLGVHQIVHFDSHRRRRIHVSQFFKALEGVLPVSRRREKSLVARFSKVLRPCSLASWNARLSGLMEMTWQGCDFYNPLASRDNKAYASKVEAGVRQHITRCLQKSLLPEHVKQAIKAMAAEVTVDAGQDVEVVENSYIGGMWPAFYVRLKPTPAARLVAAAGFLQIEAAVWGGGQGNGPSAWDEAEVYERMDGFVEQYGGNWARRLAGIRQSEESGAFDASPYEELSESAITLIDSMS